MKKVNKCKATAAAALKKVLGKRKRKQKPAGPRKKVKSEDQDWKPERKPRRKRKRKETGVAGPKAKKNKKD